MTFVLYADFFSPIAFAIVQVRFQFFFSILRIIPRNFLKCYQFNPKQVSAIALFRNPISICLHRNKSEPFHYHANCTQLTLTQLLYIIIYNFMPFIEWHFHTFAHNIIMNRKIQKHCPHQCCAHWTIGIFGIFGEQENYQNCLFGLGFL